MWTLAHFQRFYFILQVAAVHYSDESWTRTFLSTSFQANVLATDYANRMVTLMQCTCYSVQKEVLLTTLSQAHKILWIISHVLSIWSRLKIQIITVTSGQFQTHMDWLLPMNWNVVIPQHILPTKQATWPTLLLKADAKLDADVLFDSGEVSFLTGMELFNSPETVNTNTGEQS